MSSELANRRALLTRLVSLAEIRESELVSRLAEHHVTLDQAAASLQSLEQYEPAGMQAPQWAPVLSNLLRFTDTVARARKAQSVLVQRYSVQLAGLEREWRQQRQKLLTLRQAIAAIERQQRQEVARREQSGADDLVLQSRYTRS